MKVLFLIPPSEGKNTGGNNESEQLSFIFDKPSDIALSATQTDLHCKDKRFKQAQLLNAQNIAGESEYIEAIQRYSGVMFNAIDYAGMSDAGKQFFEKSFLVVSGMYGILKPLDFIGNYKLPISTKGLYKFWGGAMTQVLTDLKPDMVVNLLPLSYAKAIDFNSLDAQVVHIAFMKHKEAKLVNMAHGVKKVKGEWIKNICENQFTHYTLFGGEVIENDHDITIQIIQE